MCRLINSSTPFLQSYKTPASSSSFSFSNSYTNQNLLQDTLKPKPLPLNQQLPRNPYLILQSWLEAELKKPRSTTRARTRISSSLSTIQRQLETGRPTRPFLSPKSSARSRSSSLTSKLTFTPHSANGSRLSCQELPVPLRELLLYYENR
jgi:hypothetical protein